VVEVLYRPAFRNDITEALNWSEENFGSGASDRYAALIEAALLALQIAPLRPGVRDMSAIRPNLYSYHLMLCKDHVPQTQRVKKPRHFVMFRYDGTSLQFVRLLDDRRELKRATML
jgi:plasmid stabilization system protein ParE